MTRGRLSLTHLPVQPLSIVKSLDGPRVRVISPVGLVLGDLAARPKVILKVSTK